MKKQKWNSNVVNSTTCDWNVQGLIHNYSFHSNIFEHSQVLAFYSRACLKTYSPSATKLLYQYTCKCKCECVYTHIQTHLLKIGSLFSPNVERFLMHSLKYKTFKELTSQQQIQKNSSSLVASNGNICARNFIVVTNAFDSISYELFEY